MIDGVDADDSESCLVCISARQPDKPLAVLAVTAAVSENEQATCAAGGVQTRRNVTNEQSLLPHGFKIRGRATAPAVELPSKTPGAVMREVGSDWSSSAPAPRLRISTGE